MLRRILEILSTLLLCGLTACGTARAPSHHVVLVNHSGSSKAPDGERALERPQDFERHLAAITNSLAACTNCLTPNQTKRVLIFVHGGLNTFNQSLDRAKDIIPSITSSNYYPIFINWDSGLKSSYLEHLFLIRQGEVKRVWGPLTFPLYLAADLGRAVTRAPLVWYFQLTTDLTTVARYESPNFSRRAKQRAEPRSTMAENGLRLSIGRDRRSGWNKFRYGLTYAMTLPFKFVTGPFIDAFGKSAWENMTRRTQTMFRSPGDFKRPQTTNEIEVAKQRVGSPAGGAVARLMQSLDNLMTNSVDHYSITLVGHSMGTIVANEIIRTHPDLPYSNIVYMGAACSISDFEKSVVPYLQSRTNAHFYNLTLHPVAEAREVQWGFLDLSPRGSLLEWIDNFLSAPRTIPERTLGKWNNVISTTALIPGEVAARIRIKAFAVGSKHQFPKDNPLVHGAFSETEFWNEQYWRRRAP